MSALASPLRRRLGALVLLASVVPLAAQAPAPSLGGSPDRTDASADWLRAQVVDGAPAEPNASEDERRAARERFERALAEAQSADARTAHGFLSSFLEAHARLEDRPSPSTAGRSTRALLRELRRRLKQAGLTVRPPVHAGAPAPGSQRLARWAQAALLDALSDPLAARGRASLSSSASFVAAAVSVSRLVTPVAPGSLVRVLFAGRRLGP
jgi:nucleotide-binding universal stress UspA family protein